MGRGEEITMWTCSKCGDLKFDAATSCGCVEFTVIDEDGDEYKIFAVDSEVAALKYAEIINEGDDYCLIDNKMEVEVFSKERGRDVFIVSAEHDVFYSAKLK